MAMTKLRFNTKLAVVGGGVFFDGAFNDTTGKADSSGQTDNSQPPRDFAACDHGFGGSPKYLAEFRHRDSHCRHTVTGAEA